MNKHKHRHRSMSVLDYIPSDYYGRKASRDSSLPEAVVLIIASETSDAQDGISMLSRPCQGYLPHSASLLVIMGNARLLKSQ